jgi:hypothetical protein
MSSQNAGARWVRVALQVNPFGYKGANAPSSAYAVEADYNTATACTRGTKLRWPLTPQTPTSTRDPRAKTSRSCATHGKSPTPSTNASKIISPTLIRRVRRCRASNRSASVIWCSVATMMLRHRQTAGRVRVSVAEPRTMATSANYERAVDTVVAPHLCFTSCRWRSSDGPGECLSSRMAQLGI